MPFSPPPTPKTNQQHSPTHPHRQPTNHRKNHATLHHTNQPTDNMHPTPRHPPTQKTTQHPPNQLTNSIHRPPPTKNHPTTRHDTTRHLDVAGEYSGLTKLPPPRSMHERSAPIPVLRWGFVFNWTGRQTLSTCYYRVKCVRTRIGFGGGRGRAGGKGWSSACYICL